MYIDNDFLNRKNDVNELVKIINSMRNNPRLQSIAIDGKWGSGKTFLIGMLKETLKEDYLFITYDVWKNNFYNEPLIGLINSLMEQLEGEILNKIIITDIGKQALGCLLGFLDHLIYSATKVRPFSLLKKLIKYKKKKVEEMYNFNPLKETQNANKLVREQLLEISKIVPVIIVIDELDRCDPNYVLKVLERIHHVAEGDANIKTIFSIDKLQLRKIIQNTYAMDGQNVEESVNGYLRKIIDFTYNLNNGSFEKEQFTRLIALPPDFYANNYTYNFINDDQLCAFIDDVIKTAGVRLFLKMKETAILVHSFVFDNKPLPKDIFAFELFYIFSHIKKDPNFKHEFIQKHLHLATSRNSNSHYIVNDLNSFIAFCDKKSRYPKIYSVAQYSYYVEIPNFFNKITEEFMALVDKIEV